MRRSCCFLNFYNGLEICKNCRLCNPFSKIGQRFKSRIIYFFLPQFELLKYGEINKDLDDNFKAYFWTKSYRLLEVLTSCIQHPCINRSSFEALWGNDVKLWWIWEIVKWTEQVFGVKSEIHILASVCRLWFILKHTWTWVGGGGQSCHSKAAVLKIS